MSTYIAFYVRKKAADKVIRAAILSLYPKAQIETSADFMAGLLSDDEWNPTEQKLSKLSTLSAKLATDIFWVTYQTTMGSFIYHHWHNGSHLRTLMYGCIKEFKWERVEGQAEPW